MDDVTQPLDPIEPDPVAPRTAASIPTWLAVTAVLGAVLGALALVGVLLLATGPGRLDGRGLGARGEVGAMPCPGGCPHPGREDRGDRGAPATPPDDEPGDAAPEASAPPAPWPWSLDLEALPPLGLARLGELADELGVTESQLRDALLAVRDAVDLDDLRAEVEDLAPVERREAVRDAVLDALATSLGVTRERLDAAIAEVFGG